VRGRKGVGGKQVIAKGDLRKSERIGVDAGGGPDGAIEREEEPLKQGKVEKAARECILPDRGLQLGTTELTPTTKVATEKRQ